MQTAGVLWPGLQVAKTMTERRALEERDQVSHIYKIVLQSLHLSFTPVHVPSPACACPILQTMC